MARVKWGDRPRKERWGLYGMFIAALIAIPFFIDLATPAFAAVLFVACLIGYGVGWLAGSLGKR